MPKAFFDIIDGTPLKNNTGGFLGKKIRDLVNPIYKGGGNGNNNKKIYKNIIQSFNNTKDFKIFKYKWNKNSCWIDASLINLLGMGENNLIENIKKKCKNNNDEFCNLINNFMSIVQNTYNDGILKFNVKEKMILYNELEKLNRKYTKNDFAVENSFGSASSIYDLLLTYGDIQYTIEDKNTYKISNLKSVDLKNFKKNLNKKDDKFTYNNKNKLETIEIKKEEYDNLINSNKSSIPCQNYYYKYIEKNHELTQLSVEETINDNNDYFTKNTILEVDNICKEHVTEYQKIVNNTPQIINKSIYNKNSHKMNKKYFIKISYNEESEFVVDSEILNKINIGGGVGNNYKNDENIKKIYNIYKYYQKYNKVPEIKEINNKGDITLNILLPWVNVPYQHVYNTETSINNYINNVLKENKYDILVLDVNSFYSKKYWKNNNYYIKDYVLKSATITTPSGTHYISLIKYNNKWYVIDVMKKTIKILNDKDFYNKLDKATFFIYKKEDKEDKEDKKDSKKKVIKKFEKINFDEAKNVGEISKEIFDHINKHLENIRSVEPENPILKELSNNQINLNEYTKKLLKATKELFENIEIFKNVTTDYNKIIDEKEKIIAEKIKKISNLANDVFSS